VKLTVLSLLLWLCGIYYRKKDDAKQAAIGLVHCFAKLMDNKVGIDLVIHKESAVNTLALALNDKDLDSATKALLIKLLSVVAYISADGHLYGSKDF